MWTASARGCGERKRQLSGWGFERAGQPVLFSADAVHLQRGQAEALNDVVVNSGTSAQMIEFQLQVDDEFVYRMNADGLIIATPTGSTAYSMSAGGPIMNPKLDAVALVPMFPHSLTSRPMVVHGESEIRIDTLERNKNNPLVTCDGQVSLTLKPGDSVLVRKKSRALRLLHPPGYSFYASCRDKLRWSDALTS